MYIQVDAFSIYQNIKTHLPVYAFPELSRQFYHISQTRAAFQGSIFRLPPWPGIASACRRLRCAGGQVCPRRIAAEAASIPSRASPYFSDRLLVPRCPGLRISRVFTQPSIFSLSSFIIFRKTENNCKNVSRKAAKPQRE